MSPGNLDLNSKDIFSLFVNLKTEKNNNIWTHNRELANKADYKLFISNGICGKCQYEKNFNNLKIHTQYSICEGAIKIDELAEYCKKR